MGRMKAKIPDEALIENFKHDCFIRGLSSHTIEGYMSSLKLFSLFLKENKYTLLSVDRQILNQYIEHLRKRDIAIKTLKNRFSAFSSFYDYAVYEKYIKTNIVQNIRKRYISCYKSDNVHGDRRKIISVKDMSMFIDSIFDIRDKTIALFLAKTGIRRTELLNIDIDDIDLEKMRILLKPTHKRSNRVVFFDRETLSVFKRWLEIRSLSIENGCKALFISYNTGNRINRSGVYKCFINWAEKCGLHNPSSNKISDHFTPHCCRHWFTTHLRRAGMSREFIMELRGDRIHDAVDVYNHIDQEELRKSYLAHIPQLGIY